ncbi:MAG: NAD(P)H-hydrate dehydratase [Deltaproteobacteria bacterium]|nr:NAD(P)H-hydrate dehydratase [Deltaproteobacteria bacterium]
MRLVKAFEMQEMDRFTIQEMGIAGIVLMENAARGATHIFLEHFEPPRNARVLFLCGGGNNGGDGYVMARCLQQKGLQVSVLVLCERQKITGDALTNLNVLERMGLDVQDVPGPEPWASCLSLLENADFIVDGILGTGLKSSVRGFYRQVIGDVNASLKPVMAIDIPSGLNADTGAVMGAAIRADVTATFGFPKLGQLLFPGAGLVGRLIRVDIGIPGASADRVSNQCRLTEIQDIREALPVEGPDIHKGARGHLLLLAGSTGKTGAAVLASLAALRAGAGLVTLGIPRSLNPILENKLTEPMTHPLPETEAGTLSLGAEQEILKLLQGKNALALGPGLSTHEETVVLIRRIVSHCPLPIVIDADGLNALAGDRTSLHFGCEEVILTPHPGEMARLTGLSNSEVQADRIGLASSFARDHGCHLVLKGARTVIAGPDGRIHVNPTGNRSLASGGSGDVLTGLLGGLLARGLPPEKAAVCGVYLHGLSADYVAEKMGQVGMLAGDLLEAIPRLMAALSAGQWPLGAPPPEKDLYYPL